MEADRKADAGTDLEQLDRRIVLATQGGLPLVPRPWAAVAERLGVDEALLRARLAAMLETGAFTVVHIAWERPDAGIIAIERHGD